MNNPAITPETLLSKHNLYNVFSDEWDYFRQSYQGGKAYRDASLLYPYRFEKEGTGEALLLERLRQTPLDNHCESALHTYSSFLWKKKPQRDLAELQDDPEILALLKDADLEGTPLNEFMRTVQIQAGIYGHAWIVIDKAPHQYNTLAEERHNGIRPYLVHYAPPNVYDWTIERNSSGAVETTYLKVVEEERSRNGEVNKIVRIWTKESMQAYRIQGGSNTLETLHNTPNPIGIIPAICHYGRSRLHRGIGSSEIKDVAKLQQSIYNDLSELAQTIRNTNHSTLVKNPDDDASGGAGGVVIMSENTESGKKPYLLQPMLFQMEGLIKAIEKKEAMINRMTHLAPVRSVRTQPQSGEAIKTEFQLLNALLSEMASGLQLTEYRMLEVYCHWLGKTEQAKSLIIQYPEKFELRDRQQDLNLLKEAGTLTVNSPTFQKELQKLIASIALEDDAQLEEINGEIDGGGGENPPQ
ncbi:hypothetical protein EKD02_02670 [Chlorobium phaeovibrioides]|uniref:Phage portal protein n=2 Tax=Chlorobium phaeovibrioides TaxID=1094 RepID=A0A3S0NBG7_CHLPH|nr:hypothetical protein [Chlorobium phaeovibrioides]RTY39593.1 hypothetical protein EKD02_02670 [Chlorobium phaeovibrioides]